MMQKALYISAKQCDDFLCIRVGYYAERWGSCITFMLAKLNLKYILGQPCV